MSGSPKHEFHVPGAYHFDNPPSFTTRALGADVFLPPVASSPADSTYLDLTRSAGSLFSDFSTTAANGLAHDHGAKRKRAAQDSRESTPLAEWDANAVNNSSIIRDARRLPQQAPNGIAYTLAGQIDIHGTPAQHDAMDESVYSDVEYRRALGPHDTTTTTATTTTTTTGTTGDAQTDAERWNVLHALGSVVGKVWEFCTTGGFRGFHAGGGAAYDWETGKPTEASESADVPTNDLHTEKSSFFGAEPPTAPTHADSTVDRETTPQRNGKRRQVSMTGDELGRSWVIVDPKQKHTQTTQTQTPRRPTAQKHPLRNGRASTSATPAAASTRTPDRRATSYTRSSATTTTVTPGTAASRRINTPISRMGGAAATTTQHGRRGASAASAARVSHAGSPSVSLREPASFASPRSSTPVGGGATAASPRRPYAGSNNSINGSYNSPGGSRIPVPQPGADASYNPFSRAAAASPRPGSRAGGRSSSSMAFGATGSPAQNGHGHGHSHRRSYSGRVGMSPLPKQKSVGGVANLDADGGPLGITESPRLNDEAKRLAAQNLAAEQASDAKMEAFNLRLQQMIRQGQEALGTTFEVDGDDDDDGGGGGGGGPDDYWADD